MAYLLDVRGSETILHVMYFVQGPVIGEINRRRGLIGDSETKEGYAVIVAEVPLSDMFGFSSALRAATQVCTSHYIINYVAM
jgi:hypothetical protein